MKKLAILLCTLCVMTAMADASEKPDFSKEVRKMPPQTADFHKGKKPHDVFEQRLQLTEVQKLKAGEIRKQGHEKMKPVMEQIKAKRDEAKKIRESQLSVSEKEQKLTVIDNDLKNLEKQAKEIRKQNMKDFESILTSTQKKTLKQMKKEGRKNFKKGGKVIPPPCPIPFPKEAK